MSRTLDLLQAAYQRAGREGVDAHHGDWAIPVMLPIGVASCVWWKTDDAGSTAGILCGGGDRLVDHHLLQS